MKLQSNGMCTLVYNLFIMACVHSISKRNEVLIIKTYIMATNYTKFVNCMIYLKDEVLHFHKPVQRLHKKIVKESEQLELNFDLKLIIAHYYY